MILELVKRQVPEGRSILFRYWQKNKSRRDGLYCFGIGKKQVLEGRSIDSFGRKSKVYSIEKDIKSRRDDLWFNQKDIFHQTVYQTVVIITHIRHVMRFFCDALFDFRYICKQF
jgi:hypothetical protein